MNFMYFTGSSRMHKVLFFSRVAFICNLCFVVTAFMHYLPRLSNGWLTSTVIILGNTMAIGINILMNILYIASIAGKRGLTRLVPRWLLVANFVFLILQIILLVR